MAVVVGDATWWDAAAVSYVTRCGRRAGLLRPASRGATRLGVRSRTPQISRVASLGMSCRVRVPLSLRFPHSPSFSFRSLFEYSPSVFVRLLSLSRSFRLVLLRPSSLSRFALTSSLVVRSFSSLLSFVAPILHTACSSYLPRLTCRLSPSRSRTPPI